MNILDKLPKRLIGLMTGQGIDCTISMDTLHRTYLDLNTMAKSYAHLYHEDGRYIVRMRYDDEEKVQDLNDVLYCVKGCIHGRDFMHQGWVDILKEGFGEFSDEPLDFL
jgi:hypothetical protein